MSISNDESFISEQLSEKYPAFPEGLRVVAIEADAVCLKVLVRLLEVCRYQVTATKSPREALEKIRENKEMFDIVITGVKNLDMDGFLLLDSVVVETDLPVIMISADDSQSSVMKGITHGAHDYILKPVRLEVIKNIWQHVVRKRLAQNNKQDVISIIQKNEKVCGRKDIERPFPVVQKRQKRMDWNPRLHQKFVDVVQSLGNNAVPMQILRRMNEPTLTRANVASHLQKYRSTPKRANTESSSTKYANLWRYPSLKLEPNQMYGATSCKQEMASTSGTQTYQRDYHQFGGKISSFADRFHRLKHPLVPSQQPNNQNFQHLSENNYQNMQDRSCGIRYYPSYNTLGSECGQSSAAATNYLQGLHQTAYPGPSSLFDTKYRMVGNGPSSLNVDVTVPRQNSDPSSRATNYHPQGLYQTAYPDPSSLLDRRVGNNASSSIVDATFPQQNSEPSSTAANYPQRLHQAAFPDPSASVSPQGCLTGTYIEGENNYEGHDPQDTHTLTERDLQEIFDTEGYFNFSSSEEDLTALLLNQYEDEDNMGGLES